MQKSEPKSLDNYHTGKINYTTTKIINKLCFSECIVAALVNQEFFANEPF